MNIKEKVISPNNRTLFFISTDNYNNYDINLRNKIQP